MGEPMTTYQMAQSEQNATTTEMAESEHLFHDLRTFDPVAQQNALAALATSLGKTCCRSHKNLTCRDLIKRHIDAIDPLAAHLASPRTGVRHNAALVIGYGCRSSEEFRTRVLCHMHCIRRMITLLRDEDHGTVCNATWALRQLVSESLDLSEHSVAALRQELEV